MDGHWSIQLRLSLKYIIVHNYIRQLPHMTHRFGFWNAGELIIMIFNVLLLLNFFYCFIFGVLKLVSYVWSLGFINAECCFRAK